LGPGLEKERDGNEDVRSTGKERGVQDDSTAEKKKLTGPGGFSIKRGLQRRGEEKGRN